MAKPKPKYHFKWKLEGKNIWDVRQAVIDDLINSDLSFHEIAEKNSVSFQMVRYANSGANFWTRKLHDTFPIRLGKREKIFRAKEMFKQGLTDAEIAEKLSLELKTVIRARLKSLNE